jgi:hypothetical protein
VSGRVSGPNAVRIMIEEIGESVGPHRLSQFESKVRREMRQKHPLGGNATQWISVMAHVIVDNDDTVADEGFRRGIRRIRAQAGN